jgi:regulator of cell morphogenesis and NO signaling
MLLDTNKSVGEWAAAFPACGPLLASLGIDVAQMGRLSLQEACAQRGVDTQELVQELEGVFTATDCKVGRWSKDSLVLLTSHIVVTHHAYLRRVLPQVENLAGEMADRFGRRVPSTCRLLSLLGGMRCELENHTTQEEQVVFPWIERMEAGLWVALPSEEILKRSITTMDAEHAQTKRVMGEVRSLTNGTCIPEAGRRPWKELCAKLWELDGDLRTHIQLEECILFPRALAVSEGVKLLRGNAR